MRDSRNPRVVVDVMGGDLAPTQPIRAAAAISRSTDIELLLVGPPEVIRRELDRVEHNPKTIEVLPAHQVIGQDEKPRDALDAKPEASLAVAMRAVAAGNGDAVVSAGSTGALVLAAARYVPRIPGVERAALAAVYPTRERPDNKDRFALILDVGATVRCRPRDLLYFGYMGHAYASSISRVAAPTIGLLNMGSEATKGDDVLVRAHRLLREDSSLRFIGNVEGNDIPLGRVDVVVCEGLVGNVALKMAEGVGEVMRDLGQWAFKQSWTWRLGLLLLSSGLRRLKDVTDYREYGGAPLLGFSSPILKAHGRSSEQALANAIKVAAKASRDGVCSTIEASVARARVQCSEEPATPEPDRPE